MLNLRSKIWLGKNGRKVFGDGPCEILQRVERTGSLREAAAEIRMSYSQAWRLISKLEQNLGFSLLLKKTGGAYGGGSALTAEGTRLVREFAAFRREADRALRELYQQHFTRGTRPGEE